MEPGFSHLGWGEALAVWLAVVIIVDWAATRYGRGPSARHAPPRGAPSDATDGSSIAEPPAGT